jgi:hypothetical protein
VQHPHQALRTTTFCDPNPPGEANGYFTTGAEGKIISANKPAAPLKKITRPAYIRELFQSCPPAFNAAFSNCPATGKSQSPLLFQASGETMLAVHAYLLTSIQHTLKEDIMRSQATFEADFSNLRAFNTVKSLLHNILLRLIRHAMRGKVPDTLLRIKMKTSYFENKNCLTIQDNSLNLKRQKNGSFAGFADVEMNGEVKALPWQLIKSQVEALGGKIALDATPGRGCTFKLFLTN